jgi:serine/threonine protein kinase
VQVVGVCLRSEPMLIVLELMQHGDLKAFLSYVNGDSHWHQIVGNAHLVKLARDFSHGFQYLQQMRYVHRDLAARNVMLSVTYTAKIGDFGTLYDYSLFPIFSKFLLFYVPLDVRLVQCCDVFAQDI